MPQSAPYETMRRRIETGIALAAPLLDLALIVIDRISRLFDAEPDPISAGVRRDGGPAARTVRTPRPDPGASGATDA